MHLVDWQSVWLMDEQTSDRKRSLTSVTVEYLAGTIVADSLSQGRQEQQSIHSITET